MKRILQLFVGITLTTSIFAQTTIENFAYGAITGTSADTLTNPTFGGGNWRRHSGTGGPISYKSTSLSFPGYFSSGVGGSAEFSFLTGSREDANRSITPYTSGKVYISFLLNMSNNGGAAADYFFHLLDTSAITSFRGRHYIKAGSTANTFNIGANKGSSATPVYSPINYPLDTTLLVVIKYSFDPNFLDTISTYIFPFGTTIPASEPSTPTIVTSDISTQDIVTLNAVAIRQGIIGSMIGRIDGIRVSNAWNNTILPVKLTSFEAQITGSNTTLISWTTSTEINNSGFEIERSVDSEIFETAGFVKGAGNSNAMSKYAFEYGSDESAFYRLKQMDYDGKFNYSNIISVTNTKGAATTSPNPFNNQIAINANNIITHAEIVDMMGKVVLSQTINNYSGNLNAQELRNGIYFIKLYQGETTITKRIIKAN
jgi:hypothetical protein